MSLLRRLIETYCGKRAQSAVRPRDDRARPGDKLAISLRVVQERLREVAPGSPRPHDLSQLLGIHRVYGFVVSATLGDVVLLAKRFTAPPWDASPVLRVDDLLVALRSAHKLYVDDQRRLYTPSCSIDPAPATLERMASLSRQLDGTGTRGPDDPARQALKRSWKEAGASAQAVTVRGVPFHSNFARVMVIADYDMKSLIDGSSGSRVEGFTSLRDLFVDRLARGKSAPRSMHNRFWFADAVVPYRQNATAVVIEPFTPPLLTEEEFVGERGRIEGRGRSNPCAATVAKSFTAAFATIAAVEAHRHRNTLYLELENLYRWFALSELLVEQSAAQRAGLALEVLLHTAGVDVVPVPRELGGRVGECEVVLPAARVEYLTCGGVQVGVTLRLQRSDAGCVAAASELSAAVARRPSRGALAWSLDGDFEFHDPELVCAA
jgi:uncharacterized protein DUF1598